MGWGTDIEASFGDKPMTTLLWRTLRRAVDKGGQARRDFGDASDTHSLGFGRGEPTHAKRANSSRAIKHNQRDHRYGGGSMLKRSAPTSWPWETFLLNQLGRVYRPACLTGEERGK